MKKPTKSNHFKESTTDPSYATSIVGKSVVPIIPYPSSPGVVDHWFLSPGKEENHSREFKENIKSICNNLGEVDVKFGKISSIQFLSC